MKHLNHILLLMCCLFVTLMPGCKKGEEMTHTPIAKLSIDIRSGVNGSRATTSLMEEYTFERVRIFALDKYGDVEKCVYADNLQTDAASLLYQFDVEQSSKKEIYVVVNEPTSLTADLNAVSNKSQLIRLNYQIAESLNNDLFVSGGSLAQTNRVIAMSAIAEVDASRDNNVVIYVDRVVARVDLMVDKDELAYTTNVQFDVNTTVNVNGLYYTASLFEPTALPTPSTSDLVAINNVKLGKTTVLSLEDDERSSAKRLLSFYVAERTYDVDTDNCIEINIDNVTVDGSVTPINSKITLGAGVTPVLDEISRNYVYRIYATYNGETKSVEVSNEYAIVDWSVEELDGDIEGVMISIENQVVMDWSRLNNSFSDKDVAFGSNRSIDFFIPTNYDQATGKYDYARLNIVAQAGVAYDLCDMSLYGVADADNYLRKVTWLESARLVFDNLQAGHFEFTYQLDDAPHHLDKVSIKLVSANVHKEVEVIYDNGYVPGWLLQQNDVTGCWGDAPNGVIFSKRGDGIHPIGSEGVLYPNSSGLYDGDVQITAEGLDAYCKSKLGEKWYVPNSKQLADIQRHVLELGTSYRFNNGAGSLYWSSDSSESGSNWAVDFTKGLLTPAVSSEPTTTLHYVRCIANI